MHNAPQSGHSSNFRFYLVMTTLVIGGILFLLLMNNNDSGFSLTSSVIKSITPESDENTETSETASTTDDETSSDFTTSGISKTLPKNSKEVDVKLSFDEIPRIKKDAKIGSMEISFSDLNSKIYVNKDRLELNTKAATLNVGGFVGTLFIDGDHLSLDGTAKRLEVNGVSLSSAREIQLSFSSLEYDTLDIDQIELKDMTLPTGNGYLSVSEKLQYTLEQDELKMYYFNGRLSVNKANITAVDLEGVARGISVSGALLNFNLQ